jgi:hypothetical protein
MQYSSGPVTLSQSLILSQRKCTLDATELARNKFNALFADHDAKEIRAAKQPRKIPSKVVKKAEK